MVGCHGMGWDVMGLGTDSSSLHGADGTKLLLASHASCSRCLVFIVLVFMFVWLAPAVCTWMGQQSQVSRGMAP